MATLDDDFTTMTDDNDIDEIIDDRRLPRYDSEDSWGPYLSRWHEDDDDDQLSL